MVKVLTLGLIAEKGKILLGMKKRGFGEGRWNGFGGKLEEGESVDDGMKREMLEECGIRVEKMEKRGIITFVFVHEGKELEVHIYRILKYFGEETETEEMKPQWFEFDKIPFDKMWPDDKIWMPLFLADKKFFGKLDFEDQNTIIKHDIKEVKKI